MAFGAAPGPDLVCRVHSDGERAFGTVVESGAQGCAGFDDGKPQEAVPNE